MSAPAPHKVKAEQVMLQSFYGRDDPSVGAMVNYDDQVRRAIDRLKPTIATLTIGNAAEVEGAEAAPPSADIVAEVVTENSAAVTSTDSPAPSWDVFNARRRSSILVVQNKHGAE